MRVGRLEFGLIQGASDWSFHKGICQCAIWSLGRIYFTWLAKECKCDACKKYECKCD